MRQQTYGEIAYEAYRQSSGGKSLVSGDGLPPFHILSYAIRTAWEAAGSAVAVEVLAEAATSA